MFRKQNYSSLKAQSHVAPTFVEIVMQVHQEKKHLFIRIIRCDLAIATHDKKINK